MKDVVVDLCGDMVIAILPYENNTNESDLDVLGDMAADWIIRGLMNFDDVKVVSFGTVQDHLELASGGNLSSFADRRDSSLRSE